MHTRESLIGAVMLTLSALGCSGGEADTPSENPGTGAAGAGGERAGSAFGGSVGRGGSPGGAHAGGASSANDSGTSGGSGTSGSAGASEPGDIVFFETSDVTHDRDYHALADWINPAVSRDWTAPVNYADGTTTLTLEVVSMSDPSALPFYYLVGWGNPTTGGYVRGGFLVDAGVGTYVVDAPVKDFQLVVDGRDAGDVGDQWDWTDAFDVVNGDSWLQATDQNEGAALYPFTVRVKMVLHPAG